MNLLPIADYLAANESGVVGKSIFVIEMPSSCDQGILIMDAYSGTPVNSELPDYYDTEFRVVVRSVDFVAGTNLANQIATLFKTESGFESGNLLVRRAYPLNLPRPYRRSVGGYWEFEIDVQITFVELQA